MPLTPEEKENLQKEIVELHRIGNNLYQWGNEKNLDSKLVLQYVNKISQSIEEIYKAISKTEGKAKEELIKAGNYLSEASDNIKLAVQNIVLSNDEKAHRDLRYASRKIQYAKNRLYEGAEISKELGTDSTTGRLAKSKVVTGALVILAATFLLSSYSFPNLTGKSIAIENISLDLISFSIGIATLLILGFQIIKK